jgi:5-methyltetrahydrofolate corrinoid/iron sulfur protein methyltransferase
MYTIDGRNVYIIGENIHIISKRVKDAINDKNLKFFQDSAVTQVENGADVVDLNIGRLKAAPEIMEWLVTELQKLPELEDIPFCLDTTRSEALEIGCKLAKNQPIINSTDGEERLEEIPLMAKKYNAKLIALTMRKAGIPVGADERVGIATEYLIPRAEELDIPMEDLLVDPLVLTVSGCQEYCPECIEAVRMLKMIADPPPMTNVGLSNVSNAVPREMRPLINRTYLVMLLATGVDYIIADPMDEEQNKFFRILQDKDDSTPLGRLLLALYDKTLAMDKLTADDVDMDDQEQADIYKTVQILYNDVIYADSYLRL